jgi:chromate transporter
VRTRWVLAIGVAAGAGLLLGLPYPAIVAVGAGLGVALGRVRPAALIPLEDQEDPGAPAESLPRRALGRRALIGGALWLAPLAALLAVGGVVAELTGLFTVSALVTFGGAYAVLPFVASAAVDRYGWLAPEQMATGLALGETTPGPLILVNAFVGFLAGWGVLGGAAGGLAGALVATFATFAPSFLLIVVGAPLVPRVPTRGPIADALAALQGVVAGAVVVLAVLLADAAFLRAGGLDAVALVVAVAVLVLQRRGLPVPLLVVGAGLIGLAAGLVGADAGVLG